ncbi:unnamed protein product, partial [Allacma fusca]
HGQSCEGIEKTRLVNLEGKQQEYELGQYLKWRYMRFIDSSYHPSEVYTQSSDIDRAIMSGELVLAGLFPPNADHSDSMWNPSVNWQPIPLHTISSTEDNKIAYAVNCPRFERLFYDYLHSPEMEPTNKKYEYMYKYLSEHSQTNISDVVTSTDLYDTLYIQELHNLTLPTWTKNYYPEKLKEAAKDLWTIIVAQKEMKRLRGGPLVGDIMLNIERLVNENSRRKYRNPKAKLYLYSGHDSTIATFLGTLDVFDRQIPPYSSAVIFELHKEKDTESKPGDYFIEIHFRNETDRPPYKLEIPNCGNPCKLENFKSLYKDVIIYDWGIWVHDCQSKSTFISTAATEAFFSEIDTAGIMMLLSIFIIGMVVTGVIFLTVVLPQQQRKLKSAKESFEMKTV